MSAAQGFNGSYYPGHAFDLQIKIDSTSSEQRQYFLVMSLDKDAKLVRNEGYVRHFALKHSKAKSEADDSYSLKVYAPGFAGQYSLRVVYFATTVDDQGKQKSREQACKLSVRKGQSSDEPAHEFVFSVETHPGFDEQAFKKQRNQNVLRLFTMR